MAPLHCTCMHTVGLPFPDDRRRGQTKEAHHHLLARTVGIQEQFWPHKVLDGLQRHFPIMFKAANENCDLEDLRQ